MLILNSAQVEYGQVFRQRDDREELLSGLVYHKKLFVKIRSYRKHQEQEAINEVKRQFSAKKGQLMFLLVKDEIGCTIWCEDKDVQLLEKEADKKALISSIDLKQLVRDLLCVGGIEIKDRRYKLKTYPQCFIGSEAVEWLSKKLDISAEEAVQIGQRLIDEKWIHHVSNKHQFENDYLFYRFEKDKLLENIDEQKEKASLIDLEKLVAEMRNVGGIKIQDRRYKLKTYPRCFVGSEAVEWLSKKLNICVEEAVQIGQRLIDEKWIHHVTNERQFENDYLFYRFYWDEK